MGARDRKDDLFLMDYFSEDQVLGILNEIGLTVVSDTESVWTTLCPFHNNTDSPAFAVNKVTGAFYCFNDVCGASGSMLDLIRQVTGKSVFASHRIMLRAKAANGANVTEILSRVIEGDNTPMPTFSQTVLDGMRKSYLASQEAQDFMASRGFTDKTTDHFSIGYSKNKKMVGVPMHDVSGNPIGLIGRSIESKQFKNSTGLPKKKTLWNIHRAKKKTRVVITEASFDAMSVWQATGIDAVATLGSSFSKMQAEQINKYFTHVVIMTDDDNKLTFKPGCRECKANGYDSCFGHNTGYELGVSIAESCRGMSVSWAHLDSLKRYDGKKDANDLTMEQIAYAVENAVPHVEMSRRTYA